MLLLRTGRQVIQLGLLRPASLCNAQPSLRKVISLGIRHRLQTSVAESSQRVSRTAHAKRVFGAGAIASVGLGILAFARPNVLCEGILPLFTDLTWDAISVS
jgi:hypothetical protein